MEWKEKIGSFKQIDVRGVQGNFFQGIRKQAMLDAILEAGRLAPTAKPDSNPGSSAKKDLSEKSAEVL